MLKYLKLTSPICITLSPISVIASCAINDGLNSNQIPNLDQIQQTITDHLQQWASLSFQFLIPSQSQFVNDYFPTSQDLFGFKITNLNWNAHNDDQRGTKTITYDLKRGQTIITNQSLRIGGFLTTAQINQQSQNPELDFSKQIKPYRPQHWQLWSQWSVIKNPALRALQLNDLLNDQNQLKTIISNYITKQTFIIDQVSQVQFRNINHNAIRVQIRLQASNGQLSTPLNFIIANLNPNYYQDLANAKNFIDQLQSAINQHQISMSQTLQELNLFDYLQNVNKFDDFYQFWNYYLQDDTRAIDNLLGIFWLTIDDKKIIKSDFTNATITYNATLLYRVQKQILYRKPIQFTIYFQPTN